MAAGVGSRIHRLERKFRQARVVVRALESPRHPILAQLVATRRCNLACTYCHEFDHHSAPVETATLLDRVDQLAALGTSIVELTGGEPLLHPALEAVIERIRAHGALAGVLTNGYPLTASRIERLNRAGLDHLQISVDNAEPDETSRKSLSLLDDVLQRLARGARFDVNINCVLGAAVERPEDALVIARRARELGFTVTAGIIHDSNGQLIPLSDRQQAIYDEVTGEGGPYYSAARHNPFQRNLTRGLPNDWHCRAGARYLYVSEDGLVHWCSQQRGHPGLPLEHYGQEDLAREAATPKSCAPFCTVSCVHRVALVDRLREKPVETLQELWARPRTGGRTPPHSARLMEWMFLTGPWRGTFRVAAQRVFGIQGGSGSTKYEGGSTK
jgi:MoaA/NifB/PqqE/SkfB family radical SAM enzyme